MKDAGIVGLPGAGSSTIFTALTALPGAAPGKSNQAVVPVPDPRVDELSRLHESKKSVYATLRFVETSGMVRKGARGGAGALSAELLGHLRTSDALLLVCRAFGGADASGDLAGLTLELIYADLDVVTNKLQRDAKAARTPDEKRFVAELERAKAVLETGAPLRGHAWEGFEGLALLTLKPFVAIANVDEDAGAVPDGMVRVAGALEAEVAGMDPAEAAELLEGFGLKERALPAVIRALYDQLDLITFLTAGDTESRAWEVHRGATAPQAAGVIHSDFERGFIKADVISYDELVAAGSWTTARAAGKVRQEGKAYVVQEGDVVEFRFAV
ncbi:MAG: YchF family ATPase [Actinobacteria bacterium]|nr:YchF family ATPase [Actinomycetota bacterium]